MSAISPFRVLLGAGRRTKPAPPNSTQRLDCGAGMIGSGIYQSRTVTWVVSSQSWAVGEWFTTVNDCQLAQMTFVTPTVRFNPRRSGGFIQEGLQQIYGPFTVNDQQGFGYQLTLTHLVICPNNNSRVSRLTIQLAGASIAGAYVVPQWDRDYAYFPPQNADGNGRCYWEVPNDEWTDNFTQMAVTVTLQG